MWRGRRCGRASSWSARRWSSCGTSAPRAAATRSCFRGSPRSGSEQILKYVQTAWNRLRVCRSALVETWPICTALVRIIIIIVCYLIREPVKKSVENSTLWSDPPPFFQKKSQILTKWEKVTFKRTVKPSEKVKLHGFWLWENNGLCHEH